MDRHGHDATPPRAWKCGGPRPPLFLERFPIRWNHLIEKESLKFNEWEHVLIEKVGQLFRNRL
ncbi:hypothetical protein CU048_13165 [Beijerinckiaceae bacterium]|nr:hypothetical protein CU048_13165 [Beijerinckiaceae bacterium]